MLQNYNSKKKKPFICIFPLQMMGRQYMFALSFRYILISCDVIWCSVENIFFPSLKSVQDSRPVEKHRITNLFTLRSITSFHNLYDCELFPTCHQCCSNRKETQQQAWPRWWSCPWRRSWKSARVDSKSKLIIVPFKEKTTRGEDADDSVLVFLDSPASEEVWYIAPALAKSQSREQHYPCLLYPWIMNQN